MPSNQADTFTGRVRPGAGRCLLRILPESEDYTIPGSGLRMWLPRPSSHEGFTGQVAVECAPYYDANSGKQFEAQYKVGQIVIVGKFTGTRITLNRDNYIVCREQDIICEIIPSDEAMPSVEARSSGETA